MNWWRVLKLYPVVSVPSGKGAKFWNTCFHHFPPVLLVASQNWALGGWKEMLPAPHALAMELAIFSCSFWRYPATIRRRASLVWQAHWTTSTEWAAVSLASNR